MPPQIASLLFYAGILGLFWLDRDRDCEVRVSKALWLPTIWMLINCSRSVSMWLGMTPSAANGPVYMVGSPIDRAVSSVLVAAALAVVVIRWGQVGQILGKNWPVVLYFAYGALSVAWSDYPLITLKHLTEGIGDLAMVLIVLTEPDVIHAIERLIKRLGFTLLPLSVLLGKYYPGIGRFLNRSWWMEWTGVTTQKNQLGMLCLLTGLGLLWCFRSSCKDPDRRRRRRRLIALGTVIGMAVYLLWMCNSMTSIMGLTIAAVLLLLSGLPAIRRRRAFVHAVFAVELVFTIYALFFQSTGGLLKDVGRNSSLTGRTAIWSDVLTIPDNRVVGTGYESFWLGPRRLEVQQLANEPIVEAHDGYLEMLLNLGWVGVGLLGAMIVTGYRNAMSAYRGEPDTGGLRLAYLIGVLVLNFTTAQFRMLSPALFFFFLMIMAIPEPVAQEGQHTAGADYAQVGIGPGSDLDCIFSTGLGREPA